MSKKVQRTLLDGRRGEIHVDQTELEGGACLRTTTVLEEQIPLLTRKEVKETIVPLVSERVTVEYDHAGNVVNELLERVPDKEAELKAVTFNHDEVAALVRGIVSELKPAVQPAPVRMMALDLPEDEPAKADGPYRIKTVANSAAKTDFTALGLLAGCGIAVAVILWQLFIR